MKDTLWIPFFKGNYYIGIFSTKACRGIKSDPDFQDWMTHLQRGDVLYNSQVGTVESIKIIESNNTTALSNSAGTGSVLGEAFILGDEALALAEAHTPELRAAVPGNFGLWKAVTWYGVLKYGLYWPATATAGEAKVIRVTSS